MRVTELALALVLISAVAHAGWNFIAKRASAGPAFNWLFDTLSVLVCLPLVIGQVWFEPTRLGAIEWAFIVGSAVLELAYFILLGQAYRLGDLSLVYPVARGTGPMLATLAAVLLLGERPSAAGFVGVALVGVGVLVLAADPSLLSGPRATTSIAYALVTGLTIACYTVWDKVAVSRVGIPPILYFYLFTLCRVGMLSVYAILHPAAVQHEWQVHRKHALGIAVLSPLSYILVLYALSVSAVSFVAPLREIAIIFGVFMGTHALGEGSRQRRLAGGVAVLAGVIAIASS